jgi:hypothetical protein
MINKIYLSCQQSLCMFHVKLEKQKIKGKQSSYRPEQAQKEDTGIDLPFRDLGARSCVWSASRPDRLTPGDTRYPLYRRLGEPQGRPVRVRKISPPPPLHYRGSNPGPKSRRAVSYISTTPPCSLAKHLNLN